VASLVADLGKDDFKALEKLHLRDNKITDAGIAHFYAAIEGRLPKLRRDPQFLFTGWHFLKTILIDGIVHAHVRVLCWAVACGTVCVFSTCCPV